MFNVLSIGKSGLKANQYKMDGLADELANVTTESYKKRDTSFKELLLDQDVNMGVKSQGAKVNFSQGNLTESTSPYHMAIDGDGFFGVRDNNDNLLLTRNGAFLRGVDNNLRNSKGQGLDMEYFKELSEWEGADITISSDGTIIDSLSKDPLARVKLYMPGNLASLKSLGDSNFQVSDPLNLIEQGENPDMFGAIKQNHLEGSNADLSRAMIEMITTQRAYSLNASTIQSTDDLMRLINEIKR